METREERNELEPAGRWCVFPTSAHQPFDRRILVTPIPRLLCRASLLEEPPGLLLPFCILFPFFFFLFLFLPSKYTLPTHLFYFSCGLSEDVQLIFSFPWAALCSGILQRQEGMAAFHLTLAAKWNLLYVTEGYWLCRNLLKQIIMNWTGIMKNARMVNISF